MGIKERLLYLAAAVWLAAPTSPALAAEGFYKDLFMDGGVALSKYKRLYAAEAMGLTYDVLTTKDKKVQNALMVTAPGDLNGALLYPDGGPRLFRDPKKLEAYLDRVYR